MPTFHRPSRTRRHGAAARFVEDLLESGRLEAASSLGRAAIWTVSVPIRWKRHRALFRRGYYAASDLPAALGYLPAAARRELDLHQRSILVSALGLGEMLNCIPILKRLHALHPHPIVVLSRNPAQALRLAQAEGLPVLSLPYLLTGFPLLVSHWLKVVRPALIIAMETLEELRHGMVHLAQEKYGTRLLLLNHTGMADPDSDWRRLETDWECRRLLPAVGSAGAASEQAAAGLVARGLPAGRVERLPNLKFDVARRAAALARPDAGRQRLKLRPGERVLIFGSVYPEEHDLLVEACRRILDHPGLERTRLVLAPRYVRTVPRILETLAQHGLAGTRLTELEGAATDHQSVIVVDTTGELRALYAVADVAFVGGSMHPLLHGHNPIEPAGFGKAVVTGPYTPSFDDIVAKFLSRDGIVQLLRPEEAAQALIHLLEDPAACENLGRGALRVVEEESGAEDRYLELIAALGL